MSPIDFNGLDTTVHGPTRLGILSVLQIDGVMDFTSLKKRLDVADGLMSAHLRKLEDMGYIACKKSFIGRRPKTSYRLTPKGRGALGQYLKSMQALIDAVDDAVE